MKLYQCHNPGCGRTHTGQGRQVYCSPQCRESADRRRRRMRRQARNAKPPAVEAFCSDCEVTFTVDDAQREIHAECDWYITSEGRACAECGRPDTSEDGTFCSSECWKRYWSRRIPHDARKGITAEQIVWHERFTATLLPDLS